MPDSHLTHKLKQLCVRVVFHAVNGSRGSDPWSEVNWQFYESNLRMRVRVASVYIATLDNAFPIDVRCSALLLQA